MMAEQTTAVQEFKDGTTLKETALVAGLAGDFGVTPQQFITAIKSTVMPADTPAPVVLVFLAVAREYGLNPLTKEIAAFAKSGKIVPMVMVDGWLKIANRHPEMDGLETEEVREDGRVVAVKARVYRKDRKHPVTATEYLSECKRNTEPWNQMPVRMLTNKAIIQAIRRAFSISGIYDQDEAADIAATPDDRAGAATARGIDGLKDRMAERAASSAALQAEAVDAEVVESGAPPEEGAERTEPSGTEPAGGGGAGCVLSGSLPVPPKPEPAAKRTRKAKEGGAEPPPAAAASPAATAPAPLPPPLPDAKALGAEGEPQAAADAACYFCGVGWNPATGDRYTLPDGKGTQAYRCRLCKVQMDAVTGPAPAAPALPAAAPDAGLPCSHPGCSVRGCTVKCVDCRHVFCKAHLKLLPDGNVVCQECDS